MTEKEKKKTGQVNIYLEEDQVRDLDEICQKAGISRSALVRLIVAEGIKALKRNGMQLKLFG